MTHIPESKIMRKLKEQEKALVEKLLSLAEGYSFDLTNQEVVDMENGGIGSLYFVCQDATKEQRKVGKQIAGFQFNDSDGVLVSATLNVDEESRLYELDMWKVDFTPIVTYPSF